MSASEESEPVARTRSVEEDLSLALKVQVGFLPAPCPKIPGYSFAHAYQPAKYVAADYYDYIPLPDGRLAVVVADFVGHGIAAAMLNERLKVELECFFSLETEPAQAVTRLNTRMCSGASGYFITLLLVAIDPVQHRAVIVNAGHVRPLWRRLDGTLVEPGEKCADFPLGIIEGHRYGQVEIELRPGESLTLLTDGIIDAQNSTGETYSLSRVTSAIQGEGGDAQRICQTLVADVERFQAGEAQQDDLCIVCLRRDA